jgi:hypothetical protein
MPNKIKIDMRKIPHEFRGIKGVKKTESISLMMTKKLSKDFDDWINKEGFANRSQAIRFLMRLAVYGFIEKED